MAKRMGETEKWADRWFRSLSPNAKLWYLYMLDRCDAGGVWEVELRKAHDDIGFRGQFDTQFWKALLKELNTEPDVVSLLLDDTADTAEPADAASGPPRRVIILPSNHAWLTRFVVHHHSYEPALKSRWFMCAVVSMKKHGIYDKWVDLWGDKLVLAERPEMEVGNDGHPESLEALFKWCATKYPGVAEGSIEKFWTVKERDGWGTRWTKSLHMWVTKYHENASGNMMDLKSRIAAIDEQCRELLKDTYIPNGKTIAIPKPEVLQKIEILKADRTKLVKRIAEGR